MSLRQFILIVQLLIVTCCFWSSCSSSKKTEQALFSEMDSLLESDPDSGYMVLKGLQKTVDSIGDEAVRMRHMMYLASAENKLFLPLPSDSSFMEVVSYYDENGSSNDKMRTRYLLGCIYRDLGEAPLAMKYYQEAIDQADTTLSDFDNLTLLSIYGQLASLSIRQNLPDDEIAYLNQYIKVAKKINNVYESIRGEELKIDAFYLKQDYNAALYLTDKCHRLYLANDMPQAAASVWSTAILIYITNKNYEKAKSLLDDFEQNSGLFDSKGEIAPDRRSHYYIKGMYYLGVNELDSSNYYFRKVGSYGFKQEEYQGLLHQYEQDRNTDSIIKYVQLYGKEVVKRYEKTNGIATSHISALYNYKRNQQIASEKSKESRNKKFVNILLLIFLFSSICIFLLYRRRTNKQKEKEIKRVQNQLAKANQDLQLARQDFEEFKKTKENEIALLRSVLKVYDKDINHSEKNNIVRSDIYYHFIELSKYGVGHASPTPKEWDMLMEEISIEHPQFYEYLLNDKSLSSKELRVCILVRLGFKNNEIMTLLEENTIQNITNLKSRARKKLFPDTEIKRFEELIMKL